MLIAVEPPAQQTLNLRSPSSGYFPAFWPVEDNEPAGERIRCKSYLTPGRQIHHQPRNRVCTNGKRSTTIITPEAFRALYTRHLSELIAQKRIPSVALFEAFYNFCFVPKHTIGTQLLTVRRDKRERAAFMAMQNGAESEEEDDETQERFRISFGGDTDSAEDANAYSE